VNGVPSGVGGPPQKNQQSQTVRGERGGRNRAIQKCGFGASCRVESNQRKRRMGARGMHRVEEGHIHQGGRRREELKEKENLSEEEHI